MSHRYKIRTFVGADYDGETAEGTIIRPVDRSFNLFASSANEAESKIQQEIATGKLPVGRIYQICPQFGNREPIRAFAVCADGIVKRAYLDPAKGIYCEFRRVRYEDLRKTPREAEVAELQQAS